MYYIIVSLLCSLFYLNAKDEVIIMDENHFGFYGNVISFDFYIVNNTNLHDLNAVVISKFGNVEKVALEIDPTYKPVNKEKKIIGKLKLKNLIKDESSDYSIKISFNNLSKTANLKVFEPISQDVNYYFERNLDAFSYYGNDLFFHFDHPAAKYIPHSNFKIKRKTNLNEEVFEGLSISRYKRIKYGLDLEFQSIEIIYQDPLTKNEIVLFPEHRFDFKLLSNNIGVLNSKNNIIGDDILNIRVSNVRLGLTYSDVEEFINHFDVKIYSDELNSKIEILSEPKVYKIDESTYFVDFKIRVSDKNLSHLKGKIKLMLETNSENLKKNIKSETVRKPYTITINHRLNNGFKETLKADVSKFINKKIKKFEFNENIDIRTYELKLNELINSINNKERTFSKKLKVSEDMLGVIANGKVSGKNISAITQELIIRGYNLPQEDDLNKFYEDVITENKYKFISNYIYYNVIADNVNYLVTYNISNLKVIDVKKE